ncbi:hypothetical protein M2D63_007665 [Pseudomonas sp. BJa5]|uniref:hypothetical protein n=1 Tax=Pseudomonas sp. BJa5 TaxID=2936270 RepID=UPI0025597B29|nr:hypothetical protein [Pseudomonas sp. BGr12]MDL2420985.1 hypothetical protein [Pseudomonas sp. BGr12]
MNVYIEDHPRQDRWWVHLDVWMVSFRSLDEASAFVDRLNARISAPHSFAPMQDRTRWPLPVSGHAGFPAG